MSIINIGVSTGGREEGGTEGYASPFSKWRCSGECKYLTPYYFRLAMNSKAVLNHPTGTVEGMICNQIDLSIYLSQKLKTSRNH